MTYLYFSSVIVSGFRIYCICERNVSKIFIFLRKKIVDSIKLGLTVFSLTNLANAKILVTTTTATTATATTKKRHFAAKPIKTRTKEAEIQSYKNILS